MADSGDGLEWLLQINAKMDQALGMLNVVERLDVTLNKLTDTLGKTEHAEKKVEDGHKKHHGAIQQLEHAIHKLIEQSFEPLLKKFEQVAEFEIFRRLTDSLIEAPEKILDFVKELAEEMINVAAATERTNTSFELLFGKGEGRETLEYLEGIAKFTEFTDDHAKTAALELKKVGFEGEGLRRALAAAHDMAAFSPDKNAGFGDALSALERIKRTGRVDNRTLGGLGIGNEAFFKELSSRTGTAVDTLKKQVEKGKIDSEVMLETLYSMIGSKTGKALGGAAVQMSTTLSAQLTHLKDLPEQFFQKLATSPGLEKFKEVLGHVLDVLDPEGPKGQAIFGSLERMFDQLANVAGDIDTDALVEGLQALLTMLPEVIGGFRSVGHAIGVIADGLTKAWDVIKFINNPFHAGSEKKEAAEEFARTHQDMSLVQKRLNEERRRVALDRAAGIVNYGPVEDPSERLSRMRKEAREEVARGKLTGDGLAGGMKESERKVEKAGGDLGSAAAEGTQKKLELHSPSKLFADFGRMTAAGFVEGIEAGSDQVDGAVDAMFTRGPSSASGASSAPVAVTLEITVNVSGSVSDDGARALGEAVGDQLSPIIPSALASALQRIAIQSGTK